MASSRTVEMIPPCTTSWKPWCSALGMNEALTPSPDGVKHKRSPIGLSSPQPKQAWSERTMRNGSTAADSGKPVIERSTIDADMGQVHLCWRKTGGTRLTAGAESDR